MRNLGLILAVTFCSIMASAEQWEHNYPVTGKPEIVVDTNDGDVQVSTGSSQEVGVRVITRGWKTDELHITGIQSGNRVEIKLHRPNKACVGFCFQSIRVEVHVPRESDLNLHTEDGNVKIDDVRGKLDLETNDGNVTTHNVEGQLRANTHDGNVDVGGRFDFLNVRTGDGNVDARVAATPVPQPGWFLSSGDGNVRLRIPDNLGADLDARTGDGSVKVDLPITVAGAGQENTIRGKVNGGGISIELRTGDGDIQVSKI